VGKDEVEFRSGIRSRPVSIFETQLAFRGGASHRRMVASGEFIGKELQGLLVRLFAFWGNAKGGARSLF
jgi:hypothetical protein